MSSQTDSIHSMLLGSYTVSNDNVIQFPDGSRYEDIQLAAISAVLDPDTCRYSIDFNGHRDHLIVLLRLIIKDLTNRGP